MKTQYYTATSLDGFLATEDDSLDWLFPLGDVNDTSYPAFIAEVGALAMGSATYTWMLRHADQVAAEAGSPWPYTQPAWIFSSCVLPSLAGANTRFVQGDVRPVHAAMSQAAGAKNIWIVGGGDLAGQFFDAGLLDEIIVQVGSVTLGKGKPLFPRRVTSPPLRLVAVRQVGPGFAELRYEVPRRDTARGTERRTDLCNEPCKTGPGTVETASRDQQIPRTWCLIPLPTFYDRGPVYGGTQKTHPETDQLYPARAPG